MESTETLSGVIERLTYHNEQTGWSVLKVSPFKSPGKITTVVLYQAKVFAGASMDFYGHWTHHPKYGEQFKAKGCLEKKPASAAALQKYLGSGLIKGVGPITAKRIVSHFGKDTLRVFEQSMEDLTKVEGIATKKLKMIRDSWEEHKAIRDVMMFLQNHGISTLFAVKIFKSYGENAIDRVSENPYSLAKDIYGIGFLSADRIALKLGFEKDSPKRIQGAIRHVLSASRESGHCYLTESQIISQSAELLHLDNAELLSQCLSELVANNEVKFRLLDEPAYYSKTLYYAEKYVAERVSAFQKIKINVDAARVKNWISRYSEKSGLSLSTEQLQAVQGIVHCPFSILTGGPGCGKTTTTKLLVKLLQAMSRSLLLAAPTGRAAQRMEEVIGYPAKTLHRLLGWAPQFNDFKKNEEFPLQANFIILDEGSMLDISLASAFLKAIPKGCQLLLIGDPDQLPSVGAGCVLKDLLETPSVPHFRLTQVFRQAAQSSIVQFAHQINSGSTPRIESPIASPEIWANKDTDCFFLDSEIATQEQIQFLSKAKQAIARTLEEDQDHIIRVGSEWKGRMQKEHAGVTIDSLYRPDPEKLEAPTLTIPEKLKHVDLEKLSQSQNDIDSLKTVLKKVHPWSSLHFGMNALDSLLRLYTRSIPEKFGSNTEIQILTPQIRGTLGSANLNHCIQQKINPPNSLKKELRIGDRVYRQGDRVIQSRNNYDLGVFNGDIGIIKRIDLNDFVAEIAFESKEGKVVTYPRESLSELSLAYAITIHKSQGSEFEAVIIPVTTQHYRMLMRNLIYTGLTRAKKLAIFLGTRQALAIAIQNQDNSKRQTALTELLKSST